MAGSTLQESCFHVECLCGCPRSQGIIEKEPGDSSSQPFLIGCSQLCAPQAAALGAPWLTVQDASGLLPTSTLASILQAKLSCLREFVAVCCVSCSLFTPPLSLNTANERNCICAPCSLHCLMYTHRESMNGQSNLMYAVSQGNCSSWISLSLVASHLITDNSDNCLRRWLGLFPPPHTFCSLPVIFML